MHLFFKNRIQLLIIIIDHKFVSNFGKKNGYHAVLIKHDEI